MMISGEIRDLFKKRFGADPAVAAVAPGRVNLIGEHTDYNDGFVFPAAIDRETWVAASPADEATELFSNEKGDGESFNALTVQPGALEGWAKYPAGMCWALREQGKPVSNMRAVVISNIPMGSGVSSSAALEMAFGVTHRHMNGFEMAGPDLAKTGQVCENRFVGVNSGIMDQMASAMGRKGMAMFLDTRSLEIEYATIPAGLEIALLDTGKERALTASAYNERRSQCEEAARLLGVKALRDATLEELEARKSGMQDVVYRRARHIITENDRAQRFRDALDLGDLTEIGELMRASHVSLRDDYEVSCPELDQMAEAAWATPGCVGARMTGAGFGGACVALVEAAELAAFAESTVKAYHASSGRKGAAMVCKAEDGARVIG